jgi:hypothetical protein
MKNKEITNLSEYIKYISNHEHQHVCQWFFRGHGNESFSLTPSFFRIDLDSTYSNWERLETYIIEEFKKESISHLKYTPTNHIEWLIMAQHYGLPTRLLDWSTNSLVALYFACEDYSNGFNSNVWMYGLASVNNCWEESTIIARKIGISAVNNTIIFPQHFDSRITNQAGCFSIHEFPKNKIFKPFDQSKREPVDLGSFERIIIKAEFKREILNELYAIGIHKGFIYPGLEGITSKIKYEIETKHKRTTLNLIK